MTNNKDNNDTKAILEPKKILKHLTEAPDSQLDKSMTGYLSTLIDKPKEEIVAGLMYVLDRSVNAGLASGYVMKLMDYLFNMLGGNVNKRDEYIQLLGQEEKNWYSQIGEDL